ncbi:fungal-specific transcription factor domain-containing protein [Lipomyces orientalis]|uniref:Fungal-specific transcription factor domain-containing protein n=1 Tax=Lipomyces orientalis TaxID=1233043 RepID=A0ACC3TI62_9ASCO
MPSATADTSGSTSATALSHTIQLSALSPASPAATTSNVNPAVGAVQTATGTTRRRISRACDQCNQFRTKCDGKLPCKRCSALVIQCEYRRQMKKRGKGSQRYATKAHKDLQHQRDHTEDRMSLSPVIACADFPHPLQTPVVSIASSNSGATHNGIPPSSIVQLVNQPQPQQQQQILSSGLTTVSPGSTIGSTETSSASGGTGQSPNQSDDEQRLDGFAASVIGSNCPGSSAGHDYITSKQHGSPELMIRPLGGSKDLHDADAYMDGLDELIVPEVAQIFSNDNGHSVVTTKNSNVNQARMASIVIQRLESTTPRWLDIRSPISTSLSALFATPAPGTPPPPSDASHCAYPVLSPILPSLDFISPSLAADLLEVYFTNTIYGIAHFTRKSSILARHRRPRQCSKPLLYSFLYVAAHVSDHPRMTATPTSRTDIIAKLHYLTIQHLQPLIHADTDGTLDDVMTYIHLGIISSASEFKGASLRWWHAAWGLARVLKLNVEFSTSGSDPGLSSTSCKLLLGSIDVSEESREERRRVWWLLFLVDRHLGLCYNRPISVMDHESSGLYRPCRDDLWHSDLELIPAEMDPSRERGLSYRVTGSDVWGYFLPLMTLLGGIDDLHQLEMNNTLAFTRDITDPVRAKLRTRLDEFLKSVNEYAGATPPHIDGDDDDVTGPHSESPREPPTLPQHRRLTQQTCWKEYCQCLVHVFHILLSGYWDPIDMLSLPHTMVLDPDFVSVIQHSLDFAKCIRRILEVDQDLRIIPFFLGIHMLQGSFTLLYIVDVLGDKEVRVACETIVRAHEVCIVTLNTEYQRNFRQIMRGALQMINTLDERRRSAHVPYNHLYGGSPPKDVVLSEIGDSKRRRRGLLSLYRWCRGGNGLAV